MNIISIFHYAGYSFINESLINIAPLFVESKSWSVEGLGKVTNSGVPFACCGLCSLTLNTAALVVEPGIDRNNTLYNTPTLACVAPTPTTPAILNWTRYFTIAHDWARASVHSTVPVTESWSFFKWRGIYRVSGIFSSYINAKRIVLFNLECHIRIHTNMYFIVYILLIKYEWKCRSRCLDIETSYSTLIIILFIPCIGCLHTLIIYCSGCLRESHLSTSLTRLPDCCEVLSGIFL